MLARRSTDIALCRCGRERCELRCALLEFVFRGSTSRGGERVVGAPSSRAASWSCAAEPAGVVFGPAGEPAGLFELAESVGDAALVETGPCADLGSEELGGCVVDEIPQECERFGSDPDAWDRDVVVGPEGAGGSTGAEALHRPGERVVVGHGEELVAGEGGAHEFLDPFGREVTQQQLAACAGALGLVEGGSVEEVGAEVVFESLELGHEGAALGLEVVSCCLQGREGHRDVEAVQSVPAVKCSFDRSADVAGQSGVERGQHHGAAVNALRTQGDIELLESAANRLVLDADLPGDVAG